MSPATSTRTHGRAAVSLAGGVLVAVVVPDQAAEAISAWRRLIRATDAAKRGAFALNGPSLEAGVAYDMPSGAVVMAVDRYSDRWHVRMLRADLGGLEAVKEWTLKAALGQRVVDFVARRLPVGSADAQVRRLDVLPNRWASSCWDCRSPVPAQVGRVRYESGQARVVHHPDQCPPPPEIITPNRYAGLCYACGGWVDAGAGSAIRRTAPRESGGMYEPMHGGPGDNERCPAEPVPGPANQTAGWCADCGEPAAPGQGYWLHDRLHHVGVCPPGRADPTWITRVPAGRRLPVGHVARTRLEVGQDQPEVPDSAPGYRILQVGYVELVAVVVDTATGRTGLQRARVRAATAAEAEDVLAAEMALVPDVRPHAEGFKARFEAEKIGETKPWLAEITGRDARHGYERRFLRSSRDYANSNSKGTRGVVYGWTLAVNRVYEANYMITRSRGERVFLRSTPEGDVVKITQREVEAWLDHAPVWSAS